MTRPTDDGLQVIDFTGLQHGNADIADSCVWSPPRRPPDRPTRVPAGHGLCGIR